MKALGTLVLLVGLSVGLTACSGGDEEASDPAPTRADAPSASPAPSDDAEGGSGTDVDLADTEACDLVRQGIDAFNLGDLEGTISTFEDAVPVAEDLAAEQPSDATETLLDAVRYYAELPVQDYVEASVTSPEWARFQDFTLTACDYAGPPAEATDPAIPA